MKELTIEEKAKRYDIALKKIKMLLGTGNSCSREELEYVFPELKESEGESMKKKIIATIHLYYGEPLEDEAKEMIAWLERQSEHANFRNKIQIGDKVTRNEDGVLVNLSQLNRIAKPEEKQGEQKPTEWSEEDEVLLKLSLENLTELKDRFGKDYGRVGDCINWLKNKLKSLRPM